MQPSCCSRLLIRTLQQHRRVLCRYGKSYEAVHLEEVPHRVLTRPRKVFEYIFEGQRPARGRENMVKLDVSAIVTVAMQTAAKSPRGPHRTSSVLTTDTAAADHDSVKSDLQRPDLNYTGQNTVAIVCVGDRRWNYQCRGLLVRPAPRRAGVPHHRWVCMK